MKELSKEERLNQRIKELERQVYNMADACGDKKWKRVKKTFFALCGVIYLIMIYYGLEKGSTNNINASGIDIETIFYSIIGLTFGVGFVAAVIMFISFGIWFYAIDGSMKEEKAIAKKIGELEAIKSEKYNNTEDEKIKELERHIEFLENYQEKLINEITDLRFNKVLENEEQGE